METFEYSHFGLSFPNIIHYPIFAMTITWT